MGLTVTGTAVDEWRSRTTWGRIKYPGWLLAAVVTDLLLVFLIMVLAFGGGFIYVLLGIGYKVFGRLPDTYRDEEDDE